MNIGPSDVRKRSTTNQGLVSVLRSREAVICRGEFYWILFAPTEDLSDKFLGGGGRGWGHMFYKQLIKLPSGRKNSRLCCQTRGWSFRGKEPFNRCSWSSPPPGVARQGFVTSTIWQVICSRKDQPIFCRFLTLNLKNSDSDKTKKSGGQR